MKPVIILVSERSGSNLLRKILGAHSKISAPPPPHLWHHLNRNLPYYGSLNEEANLKKVIHDAIRMTDVPSSPLHWRYKFEVSEIMERIRIKNLAGIISAMYEAYAAREKAEIWVCKEVNLFNHVHQIRDVYPEAKFIFLARDGRDVACSVKKAAILQQHIYAIANQWREEQLQFSRVYQDLVTRNFSILVRYEDLIEDTESTLERICTFIGSEYESQMLDFHQDPTTKREAEKIITVNWENLAKPVMRNNKGKFFTEFSRRDIEIFEAVAADALEILGYPLVFNGQAKQVGRYRCWIYGLQNALQRRLKQKELFREAGRKERAAMLEAVYSRSNEAKIPLAPPITYKKNS